MGRTEPKMHAHDRKVSALRSRIAHHHSTSTLKLRVYHSTTNSTRDASFDPSAIIDVSDLNNVISVNKTTATALVEPNVPMDALVAATMEYGLLPRVVPEFRAITVGGAYVGTSGESNSFKYGFFDRTVVRAEVVLADGMLVSASATENAELFEGLRGSFGTLGVVTLVELQLMPLKSWVEVTYYATSSSEETTRVLQRETGKENNDYVDGILFSKTNGIVVSGRLTSDISPGTPIRHFTRPWDEWFWIHARSLTSAVEPTTELVPVMDYLFRYDRGAFWMGMYAYQHFFVPFWYIFRVLLNYFMHTRIMYHALHASGYTDRYIIQDLAIPAGNANAFVDYVDVKFGIYPLWLCPLREDGRVSMGHPRQFRGPVGGKEQDNSVYEGEYINVGVWGPYPSSETEYVRANRELEEKTSALGGLKWLYSRVFYTEDEWWELYDKERYEALRRKFGAAGLPSIWEKVRDRGKKREEFGPGIKGFLKRVVRSNALLSGFYGIYKAVRGGDYMLKKVKSN